MEDQATGIEAWDVLAFVAILAVCFIPFTLVWTGRYRGFALAPKVYIQFSERNTWPLTLFLMGVFLVVMLAGTLVPALNAEDTPVLWALFWVILAIVGILVVASFFTWPRFLAPRWYRDWVDRGGTRDTDVYSPEEHAAGTARQVRAYPGAGREAGWLTKGIIRQFQTSRQENDDDR